MKTLLLLLAFLCPATAQTLKWKKPLPEPTFPCEASLGVQELQSDPAGNVVVTLEGRTVVDGFTVVSGLKILWFTGGGKLLHSAEILQSEYSGGIVVVNVSGTALTVAIFNPGTCTIRKFTHRRTGVTVANTVLTNADVYARPAQVDRAGFFVCESVDGRPAFLKRYAR